MVSSSTLPTWIPTGGCLLLDRRKLTVTERKSFITAVQCIMSEPVISDPKRVPMAKSLYDDFVAVHYTSFRNTHLTVSVCHDTAYVIVST